MISILTYSIQTLLLISQFLFKLIKSFGFFTFALRFFWFLRFPVSISIMIEKLSSRLDVLGGNNHNCRFCRVG